MGPVAVITLILVLLLVAERMGYYLSTVKKGEVSKFIKNLWKLINPWGYIQRFLYKNRKFPSYELRDKWRMDSYKTVLNTSEKMELWDFQHNLLWKKESDRMTAEEIERERKYQELSEQLYQKKLNSFMNWYKENHPLYYWVVKLRIIAPPIVP